MKLPRASAEQWAETLAEERRRLQEDQDALREREENLREYEARLRSLQAEIEASRAAPALVHSHSHAHAVVGATHGTGPAFLRPSSRTPFHDDPALQAAWEKLHRAREILEAEQNHLRDDRISIREQLASIKQREHALSERETRIAEREALLNAAAAPMPEPEPIAGEHSIGAVTRFTMAPFNMARSVFGGKKDK